ncbi:MAG: MATE family efflux transporter [Oscillospiraceae bacterium]|nr:MATE family efflux transporter [Oscillospiraceae bacterium]
MAKRLDMGRITDESVNPLKIIVLLAWPVFVEQILTTLVSYADTAMVGALGKAATAAVSISNSPIMLINGIIMSLGVGITALIARSVGAGDEERARELTRHAVMMMVLVGIPLVLLITACSRVIPQLMGADESILDTAAQYNLIIGPFRFFGMCSMIFNSAFRGAGDTKTPLRINIAVNILNVIGNYFLINGTHTVTLWRWTVTMPGAGWGVAGAAAATAASMTVGGVIAIILLFTKHGPTRISIRDKYRINLPLTKQIFSISIPAMLERICMSSAGILVSRAIASLGTAVIAANSLYLTAESMSFMPGFAFATATTTLVGQSLGAKKPNLAKRYTKYTALLASCTLAVAGACLYIFGESILRFFTPDEEVIAIGYECLKLVAFLQPVQVLAWVYAGALRGAGDTKSTFYITAVTTWGIRTLGAVLLIRVFHLGLLEAVMCMCVDGFVRALLMYLRFRSGKWQHAIKDIAPEPAVPADESEIDLA